MKKILIVEDDKFLGKAYKAGFEKNGFEIYLALDGQEGLDALSEFQPDLILLDLMMPRMDGFEFLKNLRAQETHAHTPVIITSNLGQKEDIDAGMKLGATDFIIKSNVQLKDIVEKIKKHLPA